MHPKIYTRKEHSIQRFDIDEDAIWAIEKLKEAGHTAYIVGGSIRDLLLGHMPKDFDISTSARPDEIKRLFQKRCLIIGRRFQLAHLRFKDKIIETSTFRSGDTSHDGLIVRDNSWGTEEEDAFRRDFTINALYYDPEEEIIIDYVDAMPDIMGRILRIIGDPIVRFRQDPVRMLRLLKFQARFSFTPEKSTLQALCQVKDEIQKSAPARVFEEIMKMLESGASSDFFDLLQQHQFLQILFPKCSEYIETQPSGPLLGSYLRAIDHMIAQGYKQSLDRSCLTAALIFPLVEQTIFCITQQDKMPLKMGSVFSIIESAVHTFAQTSFAHFPKKILSCAFSILFYQFRLTPLKGSAKFSHKFPSYSDFRHALVLLSIRASVDHNLSAIWQAWKDEYYMRLQHQSEYGESTRPIHNVDEKMPHATAHTTKKRYYQYSRKRRKKQHDQE